MFFVATDLDGTLLTSDRLVTERAKSALTKVRSSGGVVVLVTARPLRDVTEIGQEVGANFLVCSGGAVLYDPVRGELVRATTLGSRRATSLISLLRQTFPGIRLGVDHLARCDLDPGFHVGAPGVADRHATEPLRQVAEPAVKLIAQSDEMPVDRLARAISALVGAACSVAVPCSYFVDVLPAGVHKAVGLGELHECHGRVLPSIAFGDMPSDLPMLRWADVSVATANAHPAVLEACDHVTAHHDADGVAVYLESLISTGG
ncbi:HAD family hydrolase [Lentzea sp. NEAU-D7]|uniref:HAD family hydrolase n=1 Tax=Lentzea sp. NEAU-D7 TaxID=2994667 RepID=UPI00224B2342|nr:HAD family hydrolase [Lentzea sp. NEAU-D7]MCX2952800.1 HAD family hydrolase [Lentzea sp. NEAU-D7]